MSALEELDCDYGKGASNPASMQLDNILTTIADMYAHSRTYREKITVLATVARRIPLAKMREFIPRLSPNQWTAATKREIGQFTNFTKHRQHFKRVQLDYFNW